MCNHLPTEKQQTTNNKKTKNKTEKTKQKKQKTKQKNKSPFFTLDRQYLYVNIPNKKRCVCFFLLFFCIFIGFFVLYFYSVR